MKKIKNKAQYISPRVMGASALLMDLICSSLRFNIQVNPLENVNADEDTDEVFYFES